MCGKTTSKNPKFLDVLGFQTMLKPQSGFLFNLLLVWKKIKSCSKTPPRYAEGVPNVQHSQRHKLVVRCYKRWCRESSPSEATWFHIFQVNFFTKKLTVLPNSGRKKSQPSNSSKSHKARCHGPDAQAEMAALLPTTVISRRRKGLPSSNDRDKAQRWPDGLELSQRM